MGDDDENDEDENNIKSIIKILKKFQNSPSRESIFIEATYKESIYDTSTGNIPYRRYSPIRTLPQILTHTHLTADTHPYAP